MPSRWQVPLAGPADPQIPLTAPLAVVSRWLDDPLPARGNGGDTSRSSHHDHHRKWAIGPLRSPGTSSGPQAIITLGVRLLDDSLRDRLHDATAPGTTIWLGKQQFQVADRACLIEEASWEQLRHWSGARAWQLRFITPACSRSKKRTSPLLTPEPLARGLAERWQGLHPHTAPPLPQPGSGPPVWISDIDGHSEVQNLTRQVNRDGHRERHEEIISGFVGRIRYICDQGTDQEAADFSALMAFAAYAGAGSHTTHGFGVVVPEPTWQPPTIRATRQNR